MNWNCPRCEAFRNRWKDPKPYMGEYRFYAHCKPCRKYDRITEAEFSTYKTRKERGIERLNLPRTEGLSTACKCGYEMMVYRCKSTAGYYNHYLRCAGCGAQKAITKGDHDHLKGIGYSPTNRHIVFIEQKECPYCKNNLGFSQKDDIYHLKCFSCRKYFKTSREFFEANTIKPGLIALDISKYASFSSKVHRNSKAVTNKTGYKGVTFLRNSGKYRAEIQKAGKVYRLGRYLTPEEAAVAYNVKARELYGDEAFQNEIIWSGHNPAEYNYGTRGYAQSIQTRSADL